MQHVPDSPVEWALLIGIILVLSILGYMRPVWGAQIDDKRLRREQKRSMDASAQFWASWPYDRLGEAPYGELVNEAARCEQILRVLEQRALVASNRVRSRKVADALRREIMPYCNMLAAVRSAMNHQGGSLQQSPFNSQAHLPSN